MVADFSWYAGGQIKTKLDANNVLWTYTWDGERLTRLINSRGLEIDYEYDENADLVRRTQTQNGNLVDDVRYLVDRLNPTGYSQVIAEIDVETGAVRRFNTFADELRAQSDPNVGSNLQLRSDALGSIRSLTGTTPAGNIVSEGVDYTAFGTRTAASSSLTDYAFTGQRLDAESDLQFHRARWYAPEPGTWNSVDAIFDFPVNFGSAYSYVGNNPGAGIDPYGTASLLQVGIAIAIVGVLARTLWAGIQGYGGKGMYTDLSGWGGAFVEAFTEFGVASAVIIAAFSMATVLVQMLALFGLAVIAYLILAAIALPMIVLAALKGSEDAGTAFGNEEYFLGSIGLIILAADISGAALGGVGGYRGIRIAFDPNYKPPYGIRPAAWRKASKNLKESIQLDSELSHVDDVEFRIQGSRATGKQKPDSDIDIMLRVSEERFNVLIEEAYPKQQLSDPKVARARAKALEKGKIPARKIGLLSVRDQMIKDLGYEIPPIGSKKPVQLSVVLEGGTFDNNSIPFPEGSFLE